MPRYLALEKTNIQCKVRKHRCAKSMTLSVNEFAEVLVTIPYWASYKKAIKFARENRGWIIKKLLKMEQRKSKSLLCKGTFSDYQKLKQQARKLIEDKLQRFNAIYSFRYNRVCIRNQRMRWGSCSEKKNLNFNYRIIHLPEKYADYLIIHELCHLQEMNHSPKFWQLVGKTVPNYKKLAKELRIM